MDSKQLIKPFNEFRAPKVPFFKRVIADWRASRRARKARNKKYYIATITMWTRTVNLTNNMTQVSPSWVHCFQDGKGKRTVRCMVGWMNKAPSQFNDYHQIIVPWLNDRLPNEHLKAYASQSACMPQDWTS